ncbi:MAG: hypothetical protein JNM50_04075 [Chromatiales bacterium]|nr:hypothetical protein [Chromatiales bacterium]
MTRDRIGGQADYRLLAELFRPVDHEGLAREARRLARQGLTARDVAAALRLQPDQVQRWIAEDRRDD